MRIRLDPADEYMHSLEEASNFNESMYFNVYDPEAGMGGFFRLGNRANEGYAEMTTCLYLPDGRVAFMFDRPRIEHNDAFDAGGMHFEVVEPFTALKVTYSGRAVILDDPLVMANPRKAFTESPWTEVEASLDYYGVSPMMGGEPVNDDGSPLTEDLSGGFARGHYEQHVGARGSIRVGDEEWEIDGYGLRDHSWGPRYWQAPWYYRWLTMNFGDDAGFMVSRIVSQDGRVRMGGVVFEDGAYTHVEHCEVDTEWAGEDTYHQRITATVRAGGKEHVITGEVMSMVPLRNRRTTPDGEQLVTRISEGMTRWEWNGRTGYGLSEYLDQIVDGRPVGADA